MSGNKPASNCAMFNDYAAVLSLMRTATKQNCDLSNPRAQDFYEALEVAWTAAMLLGMEANDIRDIGEANAA